jgi:hypothetical protein
MAAVMVELRHTRDCPRWEEARERVLALAREEGIQAEVAVIEVEASSGETPCLPGSPVVRIAGRDFYPAASRDVSAGFG